MRVRRALRVRALVLGSLLGGIVLLGGCDSEEPPTSGPTPTPSSTTSSTSPSPPATPTPTPSETSTIPAAARKNTPEGAEAFVRYFMGRLNLAWTTPQAGLIPLESSSNCKFCATTEETARWLVDHSQRYVRDPVTVKSVGALTGAPEGQIYLRAKLVQNASDIVDGAGDVQSSEERKSLDRNIALKWDGGRWLMLAVEKTS